MVCNKTRQRYVYKYKGELNDKPTAKRKNISNIM